MNKPFWMKLILGILIFMITMYGVLPTDVTFADDENTILTDSDDSASFLEHLICRFINVTSVQGYMYYLLWLLVVLFLLKMLYLIAIRIPYSTFSILVIRCKMILLEMEILEKF